MGWSNGTGEVWCVTSVDWDNVDSLVVLNLDEVAKIDWDGVASLNRDVASLDWDGDNWSKSVNRFPWLSFLVAVKIGCKP